MYWQDHVADTLDVICHAFLHMGDKHPTRIEHLYSDVAHQIRKKKKTDDMTAEQIIGYIYDKL